MVQFVGGITWQKAPLAQQYIGKAGDNWYVMGIQRLETPGTAGFRHTEKTLYLQGDGAWGEKAYYFPSQESADTMLNKVAGEKSKPAPLSPIAAALQKAKEGRK